MKSAVEMTLIFMWENVLEQERNLFLSTRSLPTVSPELLELREESQWDVQRLQHGSLLRLLLPTQRLGEAPPRLWSGPAGAARGQQRPPRHPLFQLRGIECTPHPPGEHSTRTPVPGGPEQYRGRGWQRQWKCLSQPQGEQFQQCLSLHNSSYPRPTRRHLPLTSDPRPLPAYWCDSAHSPHKTKLRNLRRILLPFFLPSFSPYFPLILSSSENLLTTWRLVLSCHHPRPNNRKNVYFCLCLFINHKKQKFQLGVECSGKHEKCLLSLCSVTETYQMCFAEKNMSFDLKVWLTYSLSNIEHDEYCPRKDARQGLQ